jgi:hypothetical protein
MVEETKYRTFTIYNIVERHNNMEGRKEKCHNCMDKICHYCGINKTKKDEWVCNDCYSKMDIQDLEE